jgi:hypothetical protein
MQFNSSALKRGEFGQPDCPRRDPVAYCSIIRLSEFARKYFKWRKTGTPDNES